MYREFGELLGLDQPPVAVKLSLEPPPNLARLDKKLMFCQMLHLSRREGRAFYALPEDHACGGGLFWLGIEERYTTPELVGLAESHRAVASAEAARNILRQSVRVPTGAVKVVSCAPVGYLDDHPSFEPDLVVCYCNPDQAHQIMHADHYSGDPIGGQLYYGAECSTSVAAAYVEAKIAISFSEYAARKYTKLRPEELLVTIPWGRVSTLMANLERWGAGQARKA